MRRLGAYGLAPTGLTDPQWWNEAPDCWPSWGFEWSPLGAHRQDMVANSDRRLTFSHEPEGLATVDREARRTTLHLARPLSEAGLVHPYMSTTVVAWAHWQGWHVVHAGAFVVGGQVWALVGERESGKSTAVAWCASRELAVFADDMLVLRDDTALAGPRSVDLRHSAAEHFGIGHHIRNLGNRERWRHCVGPVPAEAPFGGFVALEWSDSVSVAPAGASERLRYLAQETSLVGSRNGAWIDLLSHPMLILRRPRSWGHTDRAMMDLMEAIG